MTNKTLLRPQYVTTLGLLIATLRQDRNAIVIMVLLFTVAGALAGKLSGSVTSTAQLVLTPLPLRAATTADSLAQMIAEPMDVRTAQLLCLSDETIQNTQTRLNEGGLLEEPIKDLKTLRNALDFEITIAKDTPYETVFSPVVQLMAKAGDPKEAKAIADAWAAACIEQADRYKQLRQGPTYNAFESRANAINEQLDTAEIEMETFWRENNLELYQQRLNQLIGQVNELKQIRVTLNHDAIREEAKLAAWREAIGEETPTRELRWAPSGSLAKVATEVLDVKPAADGEDSVLVQEIVNPEYDVLRSQIIETEASLGSYKAEIAEIDATLETYLTEMDDLQRLTANLLRVEKRMTRETDLIEQTYRDAALKARFAAMASNLDQPYLQLLSHGAEWRLPRFRGAILGGVVAGVFGLLVAAGLSLVLRLILAPALEAEA